MPDKAPIFTGETCKPNRGIPINVKLLGPYKGNVWAILGLCFGYFYNMFASRCLKLLTFSLVSLKAAKFGSMDIVKLRGDTLQPGGQLETPGLVFIWFINIFFMCLFQQKLQNLVQ